MDDLLAIYDHTLSVMDEKAQELKDEYQQHMACRKGCSGCCIDGFKVRYVEAIGLLKGFIELKPETAAQILDNLSKPTQGHCPLLIEGMCSVYDSRPVLCRAFGLIIQLRDKLGCCSLNFQDLDPEIQKIKVLDLKPYYEVLDEISQRLWTQQPLVTGTEALDPEPPHLSIREYLKRMLLPGSEPPLGVDEKTPDLVLAGDL